MPPRDRRPEIGGVGGADLGSLEFWGQPAQERDRYFEMLRVMPDLEAGEPELGRSAFIHGVKRIPCTFTARA